MVVKGQTPFEIGLILVVFVVCMVVIHLVSPLILRQQLAITTKITYTSNEAPLTLLSLLNLKYDGRHTVYYALSTDNTSSEVTNFITRKLGQISNVDCFNLSNETSVIISNGNCKSFDYTAEVTIFKPYGNKLTEKVILEYNKVKK